MTESTGHKNTVREEFTKQADDYANSSLLTDPEKIEKLVNAAGASSEARVLEVATGPGHVTFEFAEKCDEVIGIDITEAPLEIARERKQERNVKNVSFEKGDAEDLSFDTNSFDIVVCRLAFHHFENPGTVLQEMSRVCCSGGTVAVDDITVSEFPERASYQNHFEQLRDPSHVRALPRSELLELFTECNIEVTSVASDVVVQQVDDWLDLAQTSASQAETVRDLIEEDANDDLSGTRPFWQDDELHFTQQTTVVVGRPLDELKINK